MIISILTYQSGRKKQCQVSHMSSSVCHEQLFNVLIQRVVCTFLEYAFTHPKYVIPACSIVFKSAPDKVSSYPTNIYVSSSVQLVYVGLWFIVLWVGCLGCSSSESTTSITRLYSSFIRGSKSYFTQSLLYFATGETPIPTSRGFLGELIKVAAKVITGQIDLLSAHTKLGHYGIRKTQILFKRGNQGGNKSTSILKHICPQTFICKVSLYRSFMLCKTWHATSNICRLFGGCA